MSKFHINVDKTAISLFSGERGIGIVEFEHKKISGRFNEAINKIKIKFKMS